MTLNKAQFTQFVENYVSQIVEGLDVEQLAVVATDSLVREYETYTEEFIVGEIEELYGEEFAQELLESVTDVDQLATIAFDLLVREYETYTEEQIVGEIEELYGEEFAQELLESVTEVSQS
jgi:predicted Zn-dependent protease with MMP-like domain